MNKTAIDWGVGQLWTWNPVVGCIRDCAYCYARKIHNRFHSDKHRFEVLTEYPHRWGEPVSCNAPRTIFVGSMTDIDYWEQDWIDGLFTVMKSSPQHTFMCLSKNANSYEKFDSFPPNMMQGLTMTCMDDAIPQTEKIEGMLDCPRPFLSIEPLLGKLYVNFLTAERVIVGAMTGPGAVPVRPEWIQSIKDHVPAEKIFWKSSITAKKDRGKL